MAGWAGTSISCVRATPSTIVDQVWRARSGFDLTVFNKVRAGRLPPSALPNITRTSDEVAWQNFRFGPSFGVPLAGHAVSRRARGRVFEARDPRTLIATPPAPNPNYKALSDLAIKLKGAVLMGHSQSGRFPLDAALINSAGIKGVIFLETASAARCTLFTDAGNREAGDHANPVHVW